jgi:type VI protein secretion system component VasF
MGFFNRSESPAKPEKVRDPIVPAYEPFNWKRYFQKKRYIPWWIILAVILTLTVLLAVYHEQIVKVRTLILLNQIHRVRRNGANVLCSGSPPFLKKSDR